MFNKSSNKIRSLGYPTGLESYFSGIQRSGKAGIAPTFEEARKDYRNMMKGYWAHPF